MIGLCRKLPHTSMWVWKGRLNALWGLRVCPAPLRTLTERGHSARGTRCVGSTHSARSTRVSRRGRRGLIGMLLSIVVAVVIVIAIFAVYNQVTAAANAAQTAVFVRQLVAQIISQYRGDYTGLDPAAAISSGFVPDNWHDGQRIRSPEGAQVTFDVFGDENARFVLTFEDGVASATCKAVLGAVRSDPRLLSVTVGAAGIKEPDVIDTVGKINTVCAQSGDFDFRLRFR